MLEAMRVMLEQGVDHAAVWGTQYLNLGSRLAALEVDEDAPGGFSYTLTAPGEVYRMMSQDLRGLQLLDLDTPASLRDAIDVPVEDRAPDDAEQLVMHAYSNANTTIVFLSSRSDVAIDIELDPSELLPSYEHVWAEVLGVIDDPETAPIDEGDPLSKLARPYVETLNEDELTGDNGLSLTLQPFEIVQFEFTTGDIGVEMAGHDQVVDATANYDDALFGTEFDDVISSHAGDDTLQGNGGADTILGGAGDDDLQGWTGNDHLDSGLGNDMISAGEGLDTLIARGGENDLYGDEGVDQFIVDIEGKTTLFDFDIDAGEGLSFLDAYNDADDIASRTVVDGDDLVIDHDGDGETRLVGLGAREADLQAALSDFQDDSPVADLVDALNTPPPDGEIPPDPTPEPRPEQAFSEEQLSSLLNLEEPSAVAALINSLSPEEEASLLDQINDNAMAIASSQQLWGAFCNNLSEEGYQSFIDGVDQEILDMRYLRLAAEQYDDGLNNLDVEDGLPLCRTFDEVSDSVRVEYYLSLSESERGQLEQYWADLNPDEVGQTAAELLNVDLGAVDAKRLDILENDKEPDFAKYLPPGIYNSDYLVEEPDDDDDDPPELDGEGGGGGGGGGCFVATCAYGDQDHPDVLFLRLYRNLELSQSFGGRVFIKVYYAIGPFLADAIRPFPTVRRIVRGWLARLVSHMRRRRT